MAIRGGGGAGRAGIGRAAQSSRSAISIQARRSCGQIRVYNQDNAYLNANYGASSDVLVAMVETPDQQCSLFDTLQRVDALEWQLRQVEGVESTNSLALLIREIVGSYNEGSMKWYELPRNQDMINTITAIAPRGSTTIHAIC